MALSPITWSIVQTMTVVLAITVSVWFLKRFLRRRKYRLPPGQTGLPIIGHVGAVHHVSLWDHREKYGDVSYVNTLGTDIVVFNSLDVIKDALQGQKTAEVFSSRPPSFFLEISPKNVVFRSMNTENWKPLRQLFHSLLKQYGEGIVELERVVSEELEVMLSKLDTRVGQNVDFRDYLQPSLINILSILSVGERFDYDHWKITNLKNVFTIGNKFIHPFVDMLFRTIPVIKFLPFGPGSAYRMWYNCFQLWMGYMHRELTQLPEDIRETHKGIVYEMMRQQKKNAWIEDAHIEGVLQDMFAAGFLTTDASLRTFILLMLHYPDIQAKIQTEIDEVVGDARRAQLSDRVNMPYTFAAILELSRYSSVASMSIPHACARDTEFRGYTIPRDAVIIPNLFRVLHDEESWKNPWDFDPTRFLDDSGDLLPAGHPVRQNLIPFGVGKRICMGEVFAKTRIFLYVTYLLQDFKFEPTDCLPSRDPRKFMPSLVLEPPPYEFTINRRN